VPRALRRFGNGFKGVTPDGSFRAPLRGLAGWAMVGIFTVVAQGQPRGFDSTKSLANNPDYDFRPAEPRTIIVPESARFATHSGLRSSTSATCFAQQSADSESVISFSPARST
jgi:hypothetical protein